LWQYTPETEGDGVFHIPQTDPNVGFEQPLWNSEVVERIETEYPVFLSAVYEHLETNIPRSLMGFSDAFWPEESPLFPRHEVVQKYLECYAQDVLPLIRFAAQVRDVRPTPHGAWSVSVLDLRTQQQQVATYDAVIVASGHYHTPYIPAIPGLAAWSAAHPGSVTHSKSYRSPAAFRNQKVAVIGAGPSGLDISRAIAGVCAPPLLLSGSSAGAGAPPGDARIAAAAALTRADAASRTLHFGRGRAAAGVDAVLLCTGYEYALPFLAGVRPAPGADGRRVAHAYRHVFFVPAPTLAFVALPRRVVPFPLAEAQAAVLARVYAGRLALPAAKDMERWEGEELRRKGDVHRFHDLPFPEDALYINEFVDWAAEASPRDGLENDGHGKKPLRWGEREFWMRARFAAIKAAFVGKGEGRVHVRTVEELGFAFEDASDEKDKVDHKAQADGR